MDTPIARVKVEFLKVTGLPAATLPAGDTRYLRAYFSAVDGPMVSTGRSRPVPNAGGDFDLTPEAAPWIFEADARWGVATIAVAIFEDHGDLPPTTLELIMTPISDPPDDPFPNGERVFSRGAGSPAVHVRITTTLINPMDSTFLARSTAPAKPSGALVIHQGFIVEIADISGLYKPVDVITPPEPGSKHVIGYSSNDNLGRIFTNRLPDGSWKKDTQFIEVQLKIRAFGGVTIPAGAEIEWTIEDTDDPTNDAMEFHRDWGRYVDSNDYDGAGKPIGAHPADNASAFKPGNTDESKLFGAAASGSPTKRWAQATSGPAVAASSRTKAKTGITLENPKKGKSSVRIHCMNVLGTNLRVRAELKGTPAALPVFHASTGVMTMWSRIDVEVVRMAGAHSVAGALPLMPKFLFPACVQLDFQAERTVTGALDKPELATSDDDSVFDPATVAWVDHSDVFKHKGQPGWFFLGAGRFPYPLPPATHDPFILSDDSTYKFSGMNLEVHGNASDATFVSIDWKDTAGTDHNASFGVTRSTLPVFSGGKTKMKLFGNDVSPEFTGHDTDGSTKKAMASMILFFPRNEWHPFPAPLEPGGYGIPTSGAKVQVFGPGAEFTTGVSPAIKVAGRPDEDFFAGRTILFTHTQKFSDGTPPHPVANFNEKVLSTVVHEFVHSFGMPHKCGHWNWRTPRKKSCCMNYFNTWLLDASKHLVPDTQAKVGNDMCGRHLMEIRRVHLEKNLGLKW